MTGTVKIAQETIDGLSQLGVSTLYLFGSRAQGISGPISDYDFGVLLNDPRLISEGSQCLYGKIYDLLQDVVDEKSNLDIVFLDVANCQLRFHVVNYGRVLFETDALKRGRFIEKTLLEHADFTPHRLRFEEATLARIS